MEVIQSALETKYALLSDLEANIAFFFNFANEARQTS